MLDLFFWDVSGRLLHSSIIKLPTVFFFYFLTSLLLDCRYELFFLHRFFTILFLRFLLFYVFAFNHINHRYFFCFQILLSLEGFPIFGQTHSIFDRAFTPPTTLIEFLKINMEIFFLPFTLLYFHGDRSNFFIKIRWFLSFALFLLRCFFFPKTNLIIFLLIKAERFLLFLFVFNYLFRNHHNLLVIFLQRTVRDV